MFYGRLQPVEPFILSHPSRVTRLLLPCLTLSQSYSFHQSCRFHCQLSLQNRTTTAKVLSSSAKLHKAARILNSIYVFPLGFGEKYQSIHSNLYRASHHLCTQSSVSMVAFSDRPKQGQEVLLRLSILMMDVPGDP